VTVCRVDDGSLAALGGLRVYDELLAVDGQNVVNMASETVAALVRFFYTVHSFHTTAITFIPSMKDLGALFP